MCVGAALVAARVSARRWAMHAQSAFGSCLAAHRGTYLPCTYSSTVVELDILCAGVLGDRISVKHSLFEMKYCGQCARVGAHTCVCALTWNKVSSLVVLLYPALCCPRLVEDFWGRSHMRVCAHEE